jgi:hypothetical protein
MIGSPKPTSYESLMPPFVNPISSSPSNQSTGPRLGGVDPMEDGAATG